MIITILCTIQVPQTATAPKKLDNLGLSHSKLNERYMSMERIQETEKDTESEDDDDDDDIAKSMDDDNLESVSQRGDNMRNYNGYVFFFFMFVGLPFCNLFVL